MNENSWADCTENSNELITTILSGSAGFPGGYTTSPDFFCPFHLEWSFLCKLASGCKFPDEYRRSNYRILRTAETAVVSVPEIGPVSLGKGEGTATAFRGLADRSGQADLLHHRFLCFVIIVDPGPGL